MSKHSNSDNKLIAAALYVIRELGGVVDRHKLFKILYFAEKHHSSKYGSFILEDTFYKMEFGPVPSRLYDIIKGNESENFEPKGYNVIGLNYPDLEELSFSNLESLNFSIIDNKDLSFTDLVEKSHGSAWESAAESASISETNIMLEGGASHDMVEYYKDKLAMKRTFENGN